MFRTSKSGSFCHRLVCRACWAFHSLRVKWAMCDLCGEALVFLTATSLFSHLVPYPRAIDCTSGDVQVPFSRTLQIELKGRILTIDLEYWPLLNMISHWRWLFITTFDNYKLHQHFIKTCCKWMEIIHINSHIFAKQTSRFSHCIGLRRMFWTALYQPKRVQMRWGSSEMTTSCIGWGPWVVDQISFFWSFNGHRSVKSVMALMFNHGGKFVINGGSNGNGPWLQHDTTIGRDNGEVMDLGCRPCGDGDLATRQRCCWHW